MRPDGRDRRPKHIECTSLTHTYTHMQSSQYTYMHCQQYIHSHAQSTIYAHTFTVNNTQFTIPTPT